MALKKIKAFTLFEIIMVTVIIGILTLGITTYMGNSGERAKIIEAQGCASAIGGELKNYVYNALTSKILKTGDDFVSPDYYYIDLINHTNEIFTIDECFKNLAETYHNVCKDIRLGYYTGTPVAAREDQRDEINTYKIINIKNTCHQGKINLGYYRSGGFSNRIWFIRMNKGFTQKKINEKKTFFLGEGAGWAVPGDEEYILIGDIIIVLCSDKECTSWKDIGRRRIDARSQTIEFQKCQFYEDDDPTRCKTREYEQDDET